MGATVASIEVVDLVKEWKKVKKKLVDETDWTSRK